MNRNNYNIQAKQDKTLYIRTLGITSVCSAYLIFQAPYLLLSFVSWLLFVAESSYLYIIKTQTSACGSESRSKAQSDWVRSVSDLPSLGPPTHPQRSSRTLKDVQSGGVNPL